MNKKKIIERITAVLLSIFTIIMNVPTIYANDNDNVQIINITECEPAESISMLAEMESDEVHTLTQEEWSDYENWLKYSNQDYESENLIKEIVPFNYQNAENSATLYSTDNNSDKCGNNATYTFDDQTKTLTISGTGAMYNFEFGKAPWESIKNSIENVVIENGITTIGTNSFIYCDNIKTIAMPDTMETVEFCAILSCKSIKKIDINAKVIEQQSVICCENLTEINLSDKVEKINWGAFRDNDKVESITLPSSVTTLWASFLGMNGLQRIIIDKNNSAFSNDENGVLYNKDKSKLEFVPINIQMESIEIPNTVTSINDDAFKNNKTLTNIVFPETVAVSPCMLLGSNYLNSWNNESNIYNFHDDKGNNYFIINSILLDFNVSGDVLNLISNFNYNGTSTKIKTIDLIENKAYPNIKTVIANNTVNIPPESLNNIGWYDENGVNIIYNNVNKSQATYKYLYSYNKNDSQVHIEDINAIGSNAFSSVSNFELYVNSDNLSTISYLSFNKSGLNKIFDKSKELTIDYFMVSSEEIQTLYSNNYHVSFKNPESFKIQMLVAIVNCENYRDKLTNEYCKATINEYGWNNLSVEDAAFTITSWVAKNVTYGFWEQLSDIDIGYSYNNLNYNQISGLSYTALGPILTGHGVCMGYSLLLEAMINNLSIEGLECITVSNGGVNIDGIQGMHMWTMMGLNKNWYYVEPQGGSILYGQKSFSGDIYVGYRYDDIDNGYLETFLKERSINYSDETHVINANGTNGTLSNDNYPFYKTGGLNPQTLDIEISKILENKNITTNIENENNKFKYSRYGVSEGYRIIKTGTNTDGFGNITLTLNDGSSTVWLADITDTVNNHTVGIGKFKDSTGREIIIHINASDAGSVHIVITENESDCNPEKVNYSFKNFAKADKVYIECSNSGITQVYDGDYGTFSKYSDFSGEIKICGVSVLNITNLKVGNHYSTVSITENGVKRTIGYYIDITEETDESGGSVKKINAMTYELGDINTNGEIDKDDLNILMRYLVGGYHFIQTGSDGDLKLEANNITLNGDISSNGTFYIKSNNANLNGTIHAERLVSDVSGAFNYKQMETGSSFPMDMISDVFNDESMMKWYFSDENMAISESYVNEDGMTVIGMEVYNDKDKYIEDINHTSFNKDLFVTFFGNYNILKNQKATNDITVKDSEIFNVQSVLYSEKGNITINSKNATINGFVYAPNGKVTINSQNLNITGTIVAKEIEIVSDSSLNFTIAQINGMSDIAGSITLTEFQLMLADLNQDTKVNVFDNIILRRKLIG